jgi:hypothetical protein
MHPTSRRFGSQDSGRSNWCTGLYTQPRQAIRLPVRREQLPGRNEMRLCLPT